MRLRVNDPKTYALTAEETYEVLQTLDRRVRIINNNNTSAWYFRSVFHDEEIPDTEEAAAAPVVPAVTAESVLATVTTRGNNGSVNMTFHVVEGDETPITLNGLSSRGGTTISCGIKQLSGLNHVVSAVQEQVENTDGIPEAIVGDVVRGIVKAIIISSFRTARTSNQAFITMSTNTNAAEYPVLAAFLDELSCTMPTRVNPNSGNEIVLWIVDLNDIPA